MIKRVSLLFCITCFLLCFSSCEKKNSEITYYGNVINTVSSKPFSNLEVKVTDGTHINSTVYTDANGQFSIKVNINEVNSNYYILVGDATCNQVKVEFKGFGQSEVNLGDIKVEGPTAATILTTSASNITNSSAVSGGNITNDGRATITARGVCWSKSEYPTIDENYTTNGEGLGEFKSEIKGLESSTTYYVRAYATSSVGTSYGEQISFTTLGVLPIVTTTDVTNIQANSANCGGTMKYDGGHTIKACGVCWSSTTSTPTLTDNHTEDFCSIGSYKSYLINLSPSTTYFVRAYATNTEGTSYGEIKIFTSGSGLPIVKTTPIGENITQTTILSGGQVVDDSGFKVTSRGIVWSTVPYPTIDKHTVIKAGSGVGYYSCVIENIESITKTYYIRAYATNSIGTAYGEQVTVTKENYDYANLPTMDFEGYNYKIYYMGKLSWGNAKSKCEDLIYGGYSDWYFPYREEVYAMCSNNLIDQTYCVWSSTITGPDYWKEAYYYYFENNNIYSNTSYVANIKDVYAVRKYKQ